MKPKAMALSSSKACLFILAAVTITSAMPYQTRAGGMEAVSEDAGSLSLGAISYDAVSQDMMADLQGFFNTSTGQELLKKDRSLNFLTWLKGDSEIHRGVVGAIGWPRGFQEALHNAKVAQDTAALRALGAQIQTAYHAVDTRNNMVKVIDAHIAKIYDDFDKGRLSQKQLPSICSELEPLVSLSTKARNTLATLRQALYVGDAFDTSTNLNKN